jgi:hypothetical protein
MLRYDPDTGSFTWLACAAAQVKPGAKAGRLNSQGYTEISISSRKYQAHRLAWLYMTGAWPEHTIDHINGVRSDNRIQNLRDVTRAVNLQNQRRAAVTNKAGLLGVREFKNRWRAQITVNGTQRDLGYFDTAQLAHDAYLQAKRQLHEGCTI